MYEALKNPTISKNRLKRVVGRFNLMYDNVSDFSLESTNYSVHYILSH